MLLGVAIGFAVGILPGLGGPTAMALMLPFVVKMTPVEAFAFLLGMACVVNTTGDITSILFGIPGEPTTAATIVDGHPMAKKGEAGPALAIAAFGSFIAGTLGVFGLILVSKPLSTFGLRFGAPEYFSLVLMGIMLSIYLASGSILKALIACNGCLSDDPFRGTGLRGKKNRV